MNIYQKINTARIELQNLKLKKSGQNQSIEYYELGDFLPAINLICEKQGLYMQFSIVVDKGQEKAILTLRDTESEERVTFTTPTAEVSLPRGQAIQGLGAKITYLRRYLLMIAFEIVESDTVDAINRDLTDEISDEDKEKIANADSLTELTKVCGSLKGTYKLSLITPLFDEAKQKLAQKESAA